MKKLFLLILLILSFTNFYSQEKNIYLVYNDQNKENKKVYPPEKELILPQVFYKFYCLKNSDSPYPLIFSNNVEIIETKHSFSAKDIPIIYKPKSFLRKLYKKKRDYVFDCDVLGQYTLDKAVAFFHTDFIFKGYKFYVIDLTESKKNKLYIREVSLQNSLPE